MRIKLTILTAMLALACLGETRIFPARVISPQDVDQDSIKVIAFSSPTNVFVVIWKYTASGAKKTLAAWEAEGNHYELSPEFKKSWLKQPTDKEYYHSKAAAEKFA